jgi:hypothetical protein
MYPSEPPARAIPGSQPPQGITYPILEDVGDPPLPSVPYTLNGIIEFNRALKLPPQGPEETIYNGALSQLYSTVPFILPRIPPYGPNGLILPTDWSQQRAIIQAYALLLGPANGHIAFQEITIDLQKPILTLLCLEANREGIWTHIGRTVFFHGKHPRISLDSIAMSEPPVRAIPGSQPSNDTIYFRPADIGPPPPH